MKLGVVCDTHNNVKNVRRIVELFNEAGVNHVVHTGDITKASTLDLFGELECPLSGVFGNNDVEREELNQSIERQGFLFSEAPLVLDFAGTSTLVVHDPASLTEERMQGHNLILHGHTHLLRTDRDRGRLIFNPGECAGHMKGLNAIGVVTVPTLEIELLTF